LSNDTSTATYEYPLFAAATSGTPTTIYTSDDKYLYKPSTGELKAYTVTAGGGIFLNNLSITANFTVPPGYSGSSTGPITLASGVSVTVSPGSKWVVL
jgi:hypothetical protein